MNFDKIEKLIQKANQDYNLLIIPDKNKVWDRLSQQLEIIENEIPRHQSLYKWDYKKFLFNPPKFNPRRLATLSLVILLSI